MPGRGLNVQLFCKIGVAEEIPSSPTGFDAIHASGSVHHFQSERAFPEIARVLVAVLLFREARQSFSCKPSDAN